jgi:hypothetical protein
MSSNYITDVDQLICLFSEILPLVSIPDLIARFKPNFESHQKRIQSIARATKNMPKIQELALNINNLIHCSKCLENIPVAFLSCKHSICENCFIEYCVEKNIRNCPLNDCSCLIEESLYNSLAPGTREKEIILNVDNVKLRKCDRCCFYLQVDAFYEEYLCNLNYCKMCIGWIFAIHKVENQSCFYCNLPLNLSFLRTKSIVCDGCSQKFPLCQLYFICPIHKFCQFCSEHALNTHSCELCNHSLSDISIITTLQTLSRDHKLAHNQSQ